MLDEWKASTDRSLANTESILRSLGSTRPAYAKAFPHASESFSLFPQSGMTVGANAGEARREYIGSCFLRSHHTHTRTLSRSIV